EMHEATSPPCLRCRLLLGAQAVGEADEQLPPHLAVLAHEVAEVEDAELREARVGDRDDRGRARRALVEQRELADVLARAEPGDGITAADHLDLAVEDEEERARGRPLPHHALARRDAALLHARSEPAPGPRAEAREQRDVAQAVGRDGHRPTLTGS